MTFLCVSNAKCRCKYQRNCRKEKLSQKLLSLKAQTVTGSNELIDTIKADIDSSIFQIEQYDDVLVRKIVEYVKVLSKEEISVTFKGGYEVKIDL